MPLLWSEDERKVYTSIILHDRDLVDDALVYYRQSGYRHGLYHGAAIGFAASLVGTVIVLSVLIAAGVI